MIDVRYKLLSNDLDVCDNLISSCAGQYLVETKDFFPLIYELSSPLFLFRQVRKELFLSLLLKFLLLIFKEIQLSSIKILILLLDFFLFLNHFIFLIVGQWSYNSGSPFKIVDLFTKSVLENNFTNYIPNLVRFLGSQKHKSSRSIDFEEWQLMDHDVLLDPFNSRWFFIFLLLDKESKWYLSSFWTGFGNIIYNKEGSSRGNNNSVTKNIFCLLDFN